MCKANPAKTLYLFKVNNRNFKKRCEICSKLTIKTPVRPQWCCSGFFIVNFEKYVAPFSIVSIIDYEQVSVSREVNTGNNQHSLYVFFKNAVPKWFQNLKKITCSGVFFSKAISMYAAILLRKHTITAVVLWVLLMFLEQLLQITLQGDCFETACIAFIKWVYVTKKHS